MRKPFQVLVLTAFALLATALASAFVVVVTPDSADACSPPLTEQLSVTPSSGLSPGDVITIEGRVFSRIVPIEEPPSDDPFVISCGFEMEPMDEVEVIWR